MIDVEIGTDNPLENVDLFFEPKFFELHKGSIDSFYFRLVNDAKTVGVSHFTASQPDFYESPIRGSYGGFLTLPDLGIDALRIFVSNTIDHFRTKTAARRLRVTLAPTAYDPARIAEQYVVLSALGFQSVNRELNQHIGLTRETPFRSLVRKEKRRQLNKLDREGVVATVALPNRHRPLYELLTSSRGAGDVPLSMEWKQVEEMVEAFRDRVFFVEVAKKSVAVAAAMVIVVNNTVIYTLYYGNSPDAQGSPVIKAIEYLYDWSCAGGYRVLDLGASSIQGVVDDSIYNFKRSLGAESSLKHRLECAL